MNQVVLSILNRMPEPLLAGFARFYINLELDRHAKITVEGLDHLNGELKRPYLFVCNHLSNSDGPVLNRVLKRERPIFVAGKKLEANSLTHLGFKLVKTISILPNSPDKDAIKQVVHALRDGNSILIFPEGTRSRTSKLNEAKRGILLIAKLTGAPIVPVGIWGTEKLMPIGADMAAETFHDAKVTVRVGEAFTLPEKADAEPRRAYEDHTLRLIMTRIAALLPKGYRGFYDDEA